MQISRLTFFGVRRKPPPGLRMQLFRLIFEIIYALERGCEQLAAMKSCSFLAQKPIKHTAESVHQKPQRCNNKTREPGEQAQSFLSRSFLRTCYQSFRLRWLGELISNNRTWHEIAKSRVRGGIFCAVSMVQKCFYFYAALELYYY